MPCERSTVLILAAWVLHNKQSLFKTGTDEYQLAICTIDIGYCKVICLRWPWTWALQLHTWYKPGMRLLSSKKGLLSSKKFNSIQYTVFNKYNWESFAPIAHNSRCETSHRLQFHFAIISTSVCVEVDTCLNKTVLLHDRKRRTTRTPCLQRFPTFLSNIFVHIWGGTPGGAPPVQGVPLGCPQFRGVPPGAPPSSGVTLGVPPDLDPDLDLGAPRTLTWTWGAPWTLTQTLTWGPLDLDPDLDLGAPGPWLGPWLGAPLDLDLDLDLGAPLDLDLVGPLWTDKLKTLPSHHTPYVGGKNWKHYLSVILRMRAVMMTKWLVSSFWLVLNLSTDKLGLRNRFLMTFSKIIAGISLTITIALFHGKCHLLHRRQFLLGYVTPFNKIVNENRHYYFGWSVSSIIFFW